MKPGHGHFPIAHDGFGRDIEDGGGFFDCQPAEETQLDDAAFAGIDFPWGDEGVVEGEDFDAARACAEEGFFQGKAPGAPATFGGLVLARVIDEDVADHLRADGEEVGTVLTVQAPRLDQLQIRLVRQSRGFEGKIGRLPFKVLPGDPPEFRVDDGDQATQGFFVASAPGGEQTGDFFRAFRWHAPGVILAKAIEWVQQAGGGEERPLPRGRGSVAQSPDGMMWAGVARGVGSGGSELRGVR